MIQVQMNESTDGILEFSRALELFKQISATKTSIKTECDCKNPIQIPIECYIWMFCHNFCWNMLKAFIEYEFSSIIISDSHFKLEFWIEAWEWRNKYEQMTKNKYLFWEGIIDRWPFYFGVWDRK